MLFGSSSIQISDLLTIQLAELPPAKRQVILDELTNKIGELQNASKEELKKLKKQSLNCYKLHYSCQEEEIVSCALFQLYEAFRLMSHKNIELNQEVAFALIMLFFFVDYLGSIQAPVVPAFRTYDEDHEGFSTL